jgi:hypothetical protein
VVDDSGRYGDLGGVYLVDVVITRPMTPSEAADAMKKIAERANHHPKKARDDGIKLLCEIARATGFYRTAEIFENIEG